MEVEAGCGGGERWGDSKEKEEEERGSVKVREPTGHCFCVVVSPPCPSWLEDLAHLTAWLAEAENHASSA